jgi:hypothetical protein
MANTHPAFDRCPSLWVEAQDSEALSFDKATWIPLAMSVTDLESGQSGRIGYRRAYCNYETIIVPQRLRPRFKPLDWQSVTRHCPDRAWADEKSFHPPGCFQGDSRLLYPVIQQSFETGEPTQWDLLQELAVGLNLLRKQDVWILPEENDVEVAKLKRDSNGKPVALLFKAEHLRDYLCAKKAALLLVGFSAREAIEEDFPNLPWPAIRQTRKFPHGNWEGTMIPIHEGGQPFGIETAVFHVWRESVNPEDDMPEMPDPCTDPAMKSETFKTSPTGRKLHRLYGRTWINHWILPAQQSPRIRRDKVEARVHFQVENQENRTLSGNALAEYRGWLWFRPGVMRHLVSQGKGSLKWYTAMTGEVGPARNETIHFGVNRMGLVNVLGYKMAQHPEWVQKLWVAYNVSPEGGLSEELHMSQNLASPARTLAPEAMLLHNLHILHDRSVHKYGQSLLQRLPSEEDFFRRVHRFYCDSFADVCELCKELHRTVVEPVDLGLLNAKTDPTNAAKANKEKLGSIKRLALWLDSAGLNGRDITRPLAAVYDLRIEDAHAKGGDVRASLELFGIPRDSQNNQEVCFTIIGLVANCVAQMADVIKPP